MNTLQRPDIYLLMITAFFFLGITTFVMGIFILVGRAVMSKDIRALTKQTARIAQKGIASDISGLVGNASAIIEALIQMVRTWETLLQAAHQLQLFLLQDSTQTM